MWISAFRHYFYLTCQSVNSDIIMLAYMRVSELLHHFSLHASQWILAPLYLTCESVNSDTILPYIRVSEFWHQFTLHTSQWTLTPLHLTYESVNSDTTLPYIRVSELWHHFTLHTYESVNSDTTFTLHVSQWILTPRYPTCESIHSYTILRQCELMNTDISLCYVMWVSWIPTPLYLTSESAEFWLRFTITCETVNSDTSLPYMWVSEFWHSFTLRKYESVGTSTPFTLYINKLRWAPLSPVVRHAISW